MAATRSVVRNILHRLLHNVAALEPKKTLLPGFSDEFTTKWQGRLAEDGSDNVLKHRVAMFLEFGLNEKDLESAVGRYPSLLKRDMEQKLKELELHLNKLGLGKEFIARLLVSSPHFVPRIDAILLNLRHVADFLSRYGLEDCILSKMLSTQPLSVLFISEHNLKRLDEILQQYKISAQVLDKILKVRPSFLCRSYDTLAARIEFMSSLGIDQSSKYFVTALATYSSYGILTLEKRLGYLLSLGFPPQNIYHILQIYPQILCIKNEYVVEKFRYLTEDMRYPLDEILKAPFYLLSSLEKKVKPRNRVILFLQSKELLKRRYALSTIIYMSSGQFVTRFVALHPDAAAVYKGDLQANPE